MDGDASCASYRINVLFFSPILRGRNPRRGEEKISFDFGERFIPSESAEADMRGARRKNRRGKVFFVRPHVRYPSNRHSSSRRQKISRVRFVLVIFWERPSGPFLRDLAGRVEVDVTPTPGVPSRGRIPVGRMRADLARGQNRRRTGTTEKNFEGENSWRNSGLTRRRGASRLVMSAEAPSATSATP